MAIPPLPQNSSFLFLALSRVAEATEQLDAIERSDTDNTSSSSFSSKSRCKPIKQKDIVGFKPFSFYYYTAHHFLSNQLAGVQLIACTCKQNGKHDISGLYIYSDIQMYMYLG